MIIGVSVLGIFISTIGTALVKSPKEEQGITLVHQTKSIIKSKIDNLEELEQKDITLLLSMISNLYQNIHNDEYWKK